MNVASARRRSDFGQPSATESNLFARDTTSDCVRPEAPICTASYRRTRACAGCTAFGWRSTRDYYVRHMKSSQKSGLRSHLLGLFPLYVGQN